MFAAMSPDTTFATLLSGPLRDPVTELLGLPEDGVLALISGVEGPSYRPVGAVMAVDAGGHRTGTLSSGCVENDIALHALEALQAGRPKVIRYGRGSPFMDIQLPCGGGLEIALVPRPDREVLRALTEARAARQPATLSVDLVGGALSLSPDGETGREGDLFRVRFLPEIRFLVFGKGPEASTFAALVQAAGYPSVLLSPDDETLEAGRAAGAGTQHLTIPGWPDGLSIDDRTAIVLFFHDHDWEPPILIRAVRTPAFYIGSQGSRRARDARIMELEAMGMTEAERARLRGPIGLVPSARDARTLAVSVLAEVLAVSAAPAGAGAT
jgi:xanthine dehydrogenase accessory factor